MISSLLVNVWISSNRLPCKHIFAIFKVVPGCSWNSPLACFSDSPLFSLDESIYSVGQKQNLVYNICASPVHENDVVVDDQVNDNEIPLLITAEGTTDCTELQSFKSQCTPTAGEGELKANDPLAV